MNCVHCSSQASHDTFADGSSSVRPSMMQNLLCTTENGRKNRLLTAMSRPASSACAGRPSAGHALGGWSFPRGDDVWNSFCTADVDENPRRTVTFVPVLAALSDSWRRASPMTSRLGDAAQ